MTRTQLPPLRSPTAIADTLVLSYAEVLRPEQRQAIQQRFQQHYPNHRVVILDGGGQISLLSRDERLTRIEAKLDALIKAQVTEYQGDSTCPPSFKL
ncbi:hypothetical protein RBI14_15520 [Alcaligenaceae bacterium B3P038]|nr:hypothetical protein [Alcaligenaceae bacterium B3P038]